MTFTLHYFFALSVRFHLRERFGQIDRWSRRNFPQFTILHHHLRHLLLSHSLEKPFDYVPKPREREKSSFISHAAPRGPKKFSRKTLQNTNSVLYNECESVYLYCTFRRTPRHPNSFARHGVSLNCHTREMMPKYILRLGAPKMFNRPTRAGIRVF